MTDELTAATRKALRRLGAGAVQLTCSGQGWIARALPSAEWIGEAVKAELSGKESMSLADVTAVRERIASKTAATGKGKTALEAVEALRSE